MSENTKGHDLSHAQTPLPVHDHGTGDDAASAPLPPATGDETFSAPPARANKCGGCPFEDECPLMGNCFFD